MARTIQRSRPKTTDVPAFDHAPPADPAKLPNLPEEIMQMIVEDLTPGDPLIFSVVWDDSRMESAAEQHLKLRTLAALARSNKAMNRLAVPVLYRNVVPVIHKNHEYPNNLRVYAISSMLIHFINHRDAVAKRLSLDSYRSNEDKHKSIHPRSFETCRSRLNELDLTDDQVDRIMSALESDLVDAVYAIALLLCPDIEELRMIFLGLDYEESIVHQLITPKINDSRYGLVLRNLRHAYCEHWDTENSLSCWLIRPIMNRPTLESFHGNIISICEYDFRPDEDEDGEDQEHVPMDPIHARHLEFRDSTMDNYGLQALLKACTRIESFTYLHGTSNNSADYVVLDFPVTGDVLRQYGSTLKRLRLEYEEAFHWISGADEENVLPFGSLKQLCNLTELTADLNALIGMQRDGVSILRNDLAAVLPDSIEVLNIRLPQFPSRADAMLAELDWQLLPVMEKFENIKHIRLHRRKTFEQDLLGLGWKFSVTSDQYEREHCVHLKRDQNAMIEA